MEGDNGSGFERISCWADWSLPGERPPSVGAVDTQENSPWHQRPWAVSGSGFQIPVDSTGASWRLVCLSLQRQDFGMWLRAAAKGGDIYSSSSQERGLQQGRGWEPVEDICSQLVLLTQPPSTAFLAPSLLLCHGVGADVFPPDVTSNSNFIELRRENISEEGSSVTSHPNVWAGTSYFCSLGRKEEHAGDVQHWLLYFNFLLHVMPLCVSWDHQVISQNSG